MTESTDNSANQIRIRIEPETYRFAGIEQIQSPAPIVYRDIVNENLLEMVRIAGSPDRLRPHCKTHKMPNIVGMKKEAGITRFKCATIAEAEMLSEQNAEDVLIAYQMVGPNIQRLSALIDKFPGTRFATIVDDPGMLEQLSSEMSEKNGLEVGVMIDLDSGMGRTGIATGEQAIQLYEQISSSPGIRPAGLHWYDGHVRQTDLVERRAFVENEYQELTRFRNQLLMSGLEIPEVVVSGTGAFPIWAECEEPNMTLSPGTTTFYDIGYLETFPDLKFTPALAMLTRVVSNRRSGFLTLDLGHKSIAADQPAGKRAIFPELPDAIEYGQTEEHLVLQTDQANKYKVGDALIALPRHVCPTSALHQTATVVSGGEVVDTWEITGRDRKITI